MSKRPSDAAIAAAFWSARKELNETPICFVTEQDADFMRRGDRIVYEAKVADWQLNLMAEVEGWTT